MRFLGTNFKLVKKEIKVFLVAFLVSGGLYAALMSLWKFGDEGAFSLGEFLMTFLLWGLFQGFLFVWIFRRSGKMDLNQKDEGKNELK